MPCFWSEKPASSDKKYETASMPGKALSLHRHFFSREARDPSRGERAAPDARQIRGHLMNIRRPIFSITKQNFTDSYLDLLHFVLNRPLAAHQRYDVMLVFEGTRAHFGVSPCFATCLIFHAIATPSLRPCHAIPPYLLRSETRYTPRRQGTRRPIATKTEPR